MKNPFLSQASLFVQLNILVSVIKIVTLFLVASRLAPSEFSPWILVQAVASYHAILSLGIITGLKRQLPLLLGASKINRYNYLLSSCVKFQLFVWIAVATITIIFILLFPAILVIGFGVILAVIKNANSLVTGVHLSRLKYNRISIGLLVQILAFIIGNIALWHYPSFELLFAVFLATQIFQFIASGGYLIVATSLRKPVKSAYIAVKHLFFIGLPLCLGALSTAVLMTGDRWIAETIFSKTVFAQYTLPAIVTSGLALLYITIGQALFPKVAIARGSVTSILSVKAEFLKMFLAIFSVMLLYVVFIAFVFPFLINIFLPQYVEGLSGTLWVSLAGLPLSFGIVAFSFLRLLKSVWWSAALQILGVICVIAIEYYFATHNPAVLSLCKGFFFGLCAYSIILIIGATMRCFREHDASPI